MWRLLKSAVLAFIEDEGLSRGAAIAFYTVNSIPPILLIVVAIAGLVSGRDATQGAITVQLGSLVHGFRSTFKGWANEYTAHPNHISEAALANVVGDASAPTEGVTRSTSGGALTGRATAAGLPSVPATR